MFAAGRVTAAAALLAVLSCGKSEEPKPEPGKKTTPSLPSQKDLEQLTKNMEQFQKDFQKNLPKDLPKFPTAPPTKKTRPKEGQEPPKALTRIVPASLQKCAPDEAGRFSLVETRTLAAATRTRIHCIAVAPDGSWIACGQADGAIAVYHSDGSRRTELRGHRAPVRVLAEKDGRLASGDDAGRALLWKDFDSPPVHLRRHLAAIRGLAFAPSGHLVSADADGDITLWKEGTPEKDARSSPVVSLALCDGKPATGHQDGTITFWNLPSLQPSSDRRQVDAPLRIGGGATVVTVTGFGSELNLWRDGEIAACVGAHEQMITGLAVLGRAVVTASADGKLKLWTLPDGKLALDVVAHDGGVSALGAAGGMIVTSGEDRSLKIWAYREKP